MIHGRSEHRLTQLSHYFPFTALIDIERIRLHRYTQLKTTVTKQRIHLYMILKQKNDRVGHWRESLKVKPDLRSAWRTPA